MLVADGEESDSDRNSGNGRDAILVSDGEGDGEEGDSGSVPHNRDDPIPVTESDSDGDLRHEPDDSTEPRQETPTKTEEAHLSQRNEAAVELRQTTPSHDGEEKHPSRSNEEPMGQQRRKAEAHAEIRQRVSEYMQREGEPDQAKAITAIKRKIEDGQTEDFPCSKRFRMTLADEAMDV